MAQVGRPERAMSPPPAAAPARRADVTSDRGTVSLTGLPTPEADVPRRRLDALLGGPLLVVLAAMLWGTNPVAVRFLYLTSDPPQPVVLSAVQSLAAAAFMALLAMFTRRARPGVSLPTGSPAGLRPPRHRLLVAGLELGVIGFVANTLTTLGFQHTSAARGAFLVRLSVLFTALLAALAGKRLARPVWLGVALACLGGFFLTSGGTTRATWSSLRTGDGLIVVAALLWALQTLRLGRHAPRFPVIPLVALELGTMALLSCLWLAVELAAGSSRGVAPAALWPGYRNLLAWGVMIYPALGPWGLGTALQVKAQNRVSPSQTQILYATDAVWAALFAGILGAAETTLGTAGWIGAACILAAAILSARGTPSSS